ncbi:unnamed protein product [Gordionus sp. m RMFG-2023]
MFTKTKCIHCKMAKKLLNSYPASFTEINLDEQNKELCDELFHKTNYKYVPQIFIDGNFVGGSDNIQYLIKSGHFEKMIVKCLQR